MKKSIRNQNHLILGAAGALGYGHVKALLEGGAQVTVLVRSAERAHVLFGEHENLDVAVGDIYDRAQMRRLACGKDFIFHGLNVSYEHWGTAMPAMTERVLEAAAEAGATVIFPGNNYSYGDTSSPISELTPHQPNSKLGEVRRQMERLLQAHSEKTGLPVLVMRFAEVWGPNVTNPLFAPVFEKALAGKALPWMVRTDVPQQFVYNLDAGRATCAVLQNKVLKGFETVNYAGEEVESVRSWLKAIADAAGSKFKESVLPVFMIRLLGLFMPVMKEVKSMIYKYEKSIRLDDSRFKALAPAFKTTPMNEAIRETLDWFRSRGETGDTERVAARRRGAVIFMVDNLAIGLFPVLVTLLGSYVNFVQANPAMFGVVAGIYWAPLLRKITVPRFVS